MIVRVAQSKGIETIQGNAFDAIAKPESFSLLYLNPPYDSEIGQVANNRMERLFLDHSRIPSLTIRPLRSLTSQTPCAFLGSPPLRRSSIRKARARGMVTSTSRAHLCVMCEGHITSVVEGRPSARTWIAPSAM